jgi:ribosomal protein S18 acetylase RimI-like enzyme
MTFTEVDERPQQLIDQLVCVWERSVRASHVFLSSADVERIKGYVPQAILAVEHLVVAFENNTPIAFLGKNKGMLEMLFVDADVRRRGIGSALLEYGVSELGIRELTVNEQNPAAVAFYEAHGFRTVDRLETDERGERWNKVQANEHRYGTEARERYGNEAVDASREKLLSMSDAEWESKEELEAAIIDQLKRAMAQSDPASETAAVLAKMHARWIQMHWGEGAYTPEAHNGLTDSYLADQRFVDYYDSRAGKGATDFLVAAIHANIV